MCEPGPPGEQGPGTHVDEIALHLGNLTPEQKARIPDIKAYQWWVRARTEKEFQLQLTDKEHGIGAISRLLRKVLRDINIELFPLNDGKDEKDG